MGQTLHRAVPPGLVPALVGQEYHHHDEDLDQDHSSQLLTTVMEEQEQEEEPPVKFPDLSHLPPELALQVLKNLNATDLCLASCVWQQLASDNILWQGLCR